jgi:hypothetical protein
VATNRKKPRSQPLTEPEATEALQLAALHVSPPPGARIEPAPRWREWINEMEDRWANRCLPLIVANEAGWVINNPYAFTAVWDGRGPTDGVSVVFDEPSVPTPTPVESHFGYGILTWAVPYLFRTPPGWNLLARGPANWPKDGICALEGLVETDWAVATFTMNWKLTRPGHAVRFEEGEPFCMIVPQRRGDLERFRPVYRDFERDPETRKATKAWSESRHDAVVRKFLGDYSRDYERDRSSWESHYFRGTAPDGTAAPAHQTHIRLAEFERET